METGAREATMEKSNARQRALLDAPSAGTIAVATLFVAALTATGCRQAATPSATTAPIATAAPPAAAADPPAPKHPPRRLEDANRKELESTLPKGAPIEITAPEGDEEAFRLAQEISIFLRSEKYGVANIVRRPPDPSAKGVGLEPLPGGRWRVIVGQPE
jgi:uncharacterized iron-regulated membrane protein